MKQLSDLLDEATAGAPPARYDVEDAVAAGRRLQRRRNTGWAIAAVTAVAVAIGVPQIATRRSAPPVQPVVTTTTTPASAPLRSFAYPFAGYTVGKFRVDDPVSVTLTTVQATIRVSGSETVSGYLTVYRPGAVSVGNIFEAYQSIDNPPINGQRAIFLQPPSGQNGPTSGLAWEYTDGGWVFAWSIHGRLKRADLTQVVKRLTVTSPRAARLVFRTSYVPKGYRLIQVDGPDPTGGVSGAYFAAPGSGRRGLSESGVISSPDDLGNDLFLRLSRLTASERPKWPSSTPVCPAKQRYCYRSLDGGRYLLKVSSGQPGAVQADLLSTLTAITVADPADPGTWTEVNRALPASAQLPAE